MLSITSEILTIKKVIKTFKLCSIHIFSICECLQHSITTKTSQVVPTSRVFQSDNDDG